jgi:hypothetical protein
MLVIPSAFEMKNITTPMTALLIRCTTDLEIIKKKIKHRTAMRRRTISVIMEY